jgi:hypothetical protein
MPRIQVGDISLNYIEHGSGDNVVLAVHGNLGCAQLARARDAAAARQYPRHRRRMARLRRVRQAGPDA